MKYSLFFQLKSKLTIVVLFASFISSFGQCPDFPVNDDPDPNSPRPPYVLSLGGQHESSTCCALGYNDGAGADVPNVSCSIATHDGAVWYRYTTGSETGLEVTVVPTGSSPISGPTTIEILSGSVAAPSGALFSPTSVSCGSLPVTLKVGCFDSGEEVWIKVASANQNCGSFTITLNAINQCPLADECPDAIDVIITNPTDPNCGSFIPVTVQGCLEVACPEATISGCGFDTLPTVWFQINIDNEAVQLGTSIQSNGTWDPIWAIYYGGCGNLTLAKAGTLTMPVSCNNGDSNPDVHTVGTILGETSYWIAVSGEGVIDDPTFTLNVWTSALCVACIGNDGCEPKATWTVTQRNGNRDLDDPFFTPGEKVTICIDYLYDASETAVDWLHGLIPSFGPGWDMDLFDPNSVKVSPNTATWYEADGTACAPIIQEQMPYLCTYWENGILKMCHTGCQICPCAGPLRVGAPLPSGWFWNTNGGAGCFNDCSPSTHYGIGQLVVNISFCVDLTVKIFDNLNTCQTNSNLRLDFQTTSDGVSGCWEDPVAECKLDFAQISPKWEISCEDVLDTLNRKPYLRQFVYHDINLNGFYDACDAPLENCTVTIPALNNISGITNFSGNTYVKADTGSYEVKYTMNSGTWISSTQLKTITFNTNKIKRDSIAFQSVEQGFKGNLSIDPVILRCDSDIKVGIDILNQSCNTFTGILAYTLDPQVTVQEPYNFDSISGNTIFWKLQEIPSNQHFNLFQMVRIPSAMNNDNRLYFKAYLITANGDTLKTADYDDIVRCSFDPNDKLVSPNRSGDQNYVIKDEKMVYTIRFQNTGNDTAYNVRIEDKLDKNIDKNSIQLISSSHDVNIIVNRDMLIFDFPNIYLPDSAKGQDISQGFVKFSAKLDSTITQDTEVKNKAKIFFDKNAPITTNTVTNTYINELPCPPNTIWIDENIIKVNESKQLYKWYDCKDKSLVAETSLPYFKPLQSGSYYAEIVGEFCNTTTECIAYIISKNEDVSAPYFVLYPNPATQELNIDSDQDISSIVIMDIHGREIKRDVFNDQNKQRTISVSSIPAGLYFTTFMTSKGVYHKSFIKH